MGGDKSRRGSLTCLQRCVLTLNLRGLGEVPTVSSTFLENLGKKGREDSGTTVILPSHHGNYFSYLMQWSQSHVCNCGHLKQG